MVVVCVGRGGGEVGSKWLNNFPLLINGFGICYMLNVCVCVLSRYLSPVVEILIILSRMSCI